jgi:hypothetical protein
MIKELVKDKDWCYYNPHPKGRRVGDCVTRAFTVILDSEYIFTRKYLRQKQFYGYTTSPDIEARLRAFNYQSNQKVFGLTVRQVCKLYPKGKVFVFLRDRQHVVAISDGIFYDSWFSGDESVSHVWIKNVEFNPNGLVVDSTPRIAKYLAK